MAAVSSSTSVSPRRRPSTLLPFGDTSDLDVVAAVTQGNREMFEVIVRRYNQLLFRVGMAYLRDHAQVEDAMQNTYVKAFLHLPKFGGHALFSTWIMRIMINECLMMLRHRRRHPEASFELLTTEVGTEPIMFDEGEPAERNDRAAVDHANRNELKALLEKAIATLPRKYRAVYVLREIQQLSTAEVAATLGVSTGSVKVDLHRARERLKAELLRSSAAPELFAYPAQFCDPMSARVMRAVMALN